VTVVLLVEDKPPLGEGVVKAEGMADTDFCCTKLLLLNMLP